MYHLPPLFQYFSVFYNDSFYKKSYNVSKMIRKLYRGVNIVGGIAKNREKCFFFPFTLILSCRLILSKKSNWLWDLQRTGIDACFRTCHIILVKTRCEFENVISKIMLDADLIRFCICHIKYLLCKSINWFLYEGYTVI